MRTGATDLSGLLAQASALSAQQAEITRQLSTGTRLGTLSNDPVAAADTVRLSSSIAQASATLSAVQSAQSRVQAADAALGSVNDRLTAAVAQAISGANGTLSAANRSALATQLGSIRDSVLSLANSSYNGSYLFAGTATGAAPFNKDAVTGEVAYLGDAVASTLVLYGAALPTSLAGTTVFGNGPSSVFSALQDAITTLNNGDALSTAQVTALRDGLQTVIDQRSLLGTSAARLEDASTYTNTLQTNLKTAQTSVAASDTAALATELSAAATQRSALLSSIAMLGKGSLFDYL